MTIVQNQNQNQNQNQSKSLVEKTLYTTPPLRCRQHLFSPAVSVVVPAIHHTLFSLRRFQLGTKAAGSFNHHGMQYSTTVPNDPDIHKDFRPTNKLESSGLSLKDIVEQDVKDNPVMIYMKGVPDLPRCGFSSLFVRVLKEYTTGPHFHKYLSRGSSSEDQTSFSTCTRGLLKFMTDRGRIYLSTSRRNFRGTDMLNNDHMMIMFLAVTSRFAMAMVPFARTATTVTMMSPTLIVTSSMVTTTTATMSVITVTMLMNMMSQAMTVVLVNKMSPAVTVMPSDVTSCTSVMSTGAVVS